MIGSTLDGRYRIDAVLGMGGMGCVYRGVHTGLQRPFAIKVLETQSDRATIESFRREAFASGQLDHPNIIAVSDFGALEDGSMFLAMELLDGESLRTRLDRDGVLAWTDAIEIMRGMLSGLGYAHDREIVHCDVKPENIFLARKHGDVFVKLLDFGIARLLGRSSADDLTHGTPDYVCPEQAKREEITAASDIYSASVVLYEMIAGSPPFAGITAHEKLHAHVHDQVPPFESDLKVPPRLEELVRKGLAKDPKLRVVSAHDFVHQIDDLLLEMGLGVLVEQMGSPFAMPRTTTPRSIERAPELPRTVTTSRHTWRRTKRRVVSG